MNFITFIMSKFLKIIRKHKKLVNIGKNNTINIDDGIKFKIKINGDNNIINIKYTDSIKSKRKRKKSKFIINICGNNNSIIIDELNDYNCGTLNIDIGNYTGCDNVNINIGKHLVVVNANIYAFMSGVPITIGDDCLISKDIVIRSGELPHIIYDTKNNRNLDKSDGIYIGNHVWLGEHVYIMKNASIPDNCIVGSCAVVTKRFKENNVVIAGNPAVVCKHDINWALTKDQIKDICLL